MNVHMLSDKVKIINLEDMPEGRRYEDTYGSYLRIFEVVAITDPNIEIRVKGAPWSWVPLLQYLDCSIAPQDCRMYFSHCVIVRNAMERLNITLDRTATEVLCGFRPETIEALWKVDMQWKSKRPFRAQEKEFIVTNTASFFRPEILEYFEHLNKYQPTKRKVLIVPCAADKPYPSPLHSKIMEFLPDDYYLMCVTGTLGLVPQDLWPVMPHYDAGVPNEWRAYEEVKKYFNRTSHSKVVVYSDFYNKAIDVGLSRAGLHRNFGAVQFVTEIKTYDDYTDLLNQDMLDKLKFVLKTGLVLNP